MGLAPKLLHYRSTPSGALLSSNLTFHNSLIILILLLKINTLWIFKLDNYGQVKTPKFDYVVQKH